LLEGNLNFHKIVFNVPWSEVSKVSFSVATTPSATRPLAYFSEKWQLLEESQGLVLLRNRRQEGAKQDLLAYVEDLEGSKTGAV
jgi:hypothetical protein